MVVLLWRWFFCSHKYGPFFWLQSPTCCNAETPKHFQFYLLCLLRHVIFTDSWLDWDLVIEPIGSVANHTELTLFVSFCAIVWFEKKAIIVSHFSRIRRMSFPSPTRWQQRLEPRVPGHIMFQASEGPQLHPDRSAPASPCRHRGWQPSTGPPGSTSSILLSQPGALENRATLCQVGKQTGGKQTHLWMSGISEYPDPSHIRSTKRLQTDQVSLVFSQDNHRLIKANETLCVKLREAEQEVDMLKSLLKRHALHPYEEDSSW